MKVHMSESCTLRNGIVIMRHVGIRNLGVTENAFREFFMYCFFGSQCCIVTMSASGCVSVA